MMRIHLRLYDSEVLGPNFISVTTELPGYFPVHTAMNITGVSQLKCDISRLSVSCYSPLSDQ
jgi:hypothetical protein